MFKELTPKEQAEQIIQSNGQCPKFKGKGYGCNKACIGRVLLFKPGCSYWDLVALAEKTLKIEKMKDLLDE